MALVHERLGLLGLRVVDDRRERLVVDVNQFGRVLSQVAAFGDGEGHRIADEAHFVLGERRPGGLRALRSERGMPLLLGVRIEIGRREHGYARPGAPAPLEVSMARIAALANGLRTK